MNQDPRYTATHPETDPKRIEGIFARIHGKYGEFKPTLLHANTERGHRTYRLDTKLGPQYVLKIHGENFGLPDGIIKEVTDRDVLRAIFEQAGLEHWVITEIIEYDAKENWSLAKFEQFQTLYEIYKLDRTEFRRVVLTFYDTILLPLLEQLPHDTIVPGDYGLDDIGFRAGTFFFYDIEKNKTLLRVTVDIYSKFIHLYGKRQRLGDTDAVAFLSELLDDIRRVQQHFVDTNTFNQALADRLQSSVLQDTIKGTEKEIWQRFRHFPIDT